MTDVFLYSGESNANDIKLTDPTVLAGGGVNAEAFSPGVEAVASVGTTVATGGAIIAATGVEAVAAIGTSAETGGALVAPAGVSVTASVGTPVESGAAEIAVSGVEAVSSVGAVASTGSAVVLASGVEMVSAVGAAVESGEAVAEPSGVSAVASVGDSSVSGDALIAPSGVEMLTAIGASVASGDSIAFPVGVEMVAAVGTAVASGTVVTEAVGGGWTPDDYGQATPDRRGLSPYWALRDYGKQTNTQQPRRVSAVARPSGVSAQCAVVGRPPSTGSAMAAPVATGTISAVGVANVRGVQNLSDEALLIFLDAAA